MYKIIFTITEMCNLFSPLLDPNKLICLKSGMVVNDDIATQLMEFKNTGKKWINEFIDDCKSDQNNSRRDYLEDRFTTSTMEI